MWVYRTRRSPSSLTICRSLECTFRFTGPYTTCTPIFSISLAQSMLLLSSNLARSSMSTETVFPFSFAFMRALISDGSFPILYRQILMLCTSGSSAASLTKRTMVENDSYGWYRIQSLSRMASKRSIPSASSGGM